MHFSNKVLIKRKVQLITYLRIGTHDRNLGFIWRKTGLSSFRYLNFSFVFKCSFVFTFRFCLVDNFIFTRGSKLSEYLRWTMFLRFKSAHFVYEELYKTPGALLKLPWTWLLAPSAPSTSPNDTDTRTQYPRAARSLSELRFSVFQKFPKERKRQSLDKFSEFPDLSEKICTRAKMPQIPALAWIFGLHAIPFVFWYLFKNAEHSVSLIGLRACPSD